MNADYCRLYADSDGESHFEDVSVELREVDFASPAPALLLSEFGPAVRAALLGGPKGWQGEWHRSSGRNLFVVISGEWEVEASDGEKRTFSPTGVLLLEDTFGKGHNSRVISSDDSLALLVELSRQ
jgi:quercetin dioxygenase-like cupin family protein